MDSTLQFTALIASFLAIFIVSPTHAAGKLDTFSSTISPLLDTGVKQLPEATVNEILPHADALVQIVGENSLIPFFKYFAESCRKYAKNQAVPETPPPSSDSEPIPKGVASTDNEQVTGKEVVKDQEERKNDKVEVVGKGEGKDKEEVKGKEVVKDQEEKPEVPQKSAEEQQQTADAKEEESDNESASATASKTKAKQRVPNKVSGLVDKNPYKFILKEAQVILLKDGNTVNVTVIKKAGNGGVSSNTKSFPLVNVANLTVRKLVEPLVN